MTKEEKLELWDALMQVIHHKGYGIGNSDVAEVLNELAEYYGD